MRKNSPRTGSTGLSFALPVNQVVYAGSLPRFPHYHHHETKNHRLFAENCQKYAETQGRFHQLPDPFLADGPRFGQNREMEERIEQMEGQDQEIEDQIGQIEDQFQDPFGRFQQMDLDFQDIAGQF